MAAPTSVSRTTTAVTTASSSWTVNLDPALANGDLLIIILRTAEAETSTWPSGYQNWLVSGGINTWHDLQADTSDDVVTIVVRDCDGSEASSINVTFGTTCKGCAVAYRISGAAAWSVTVPDSNHANGSSTNPDPPSVNVAGGPKDILAIALDTHVGEQTTTVTYPTNYGNTGQITSGSGGSVATNCQINYCDRQVTAASSEDPSAFTISGSQAWAAITILVQEPAGGAVSVTPTTVTGIASTFGPTTAASAAHTTTTVARTSVVETPTARMHVYITTTTVVGTATIFTPTVSAIQNVAITTTTVFGTAATWAPDVVGNSNAPPDTVVALATIPTPITQIHVYITTTTVARIATVDTPIVAINILLTVGNVAGIATIPTPLVETVNPNAYITPDPVIGTATTWIPTFKLDAVLTTTTVARASTIEMPVLAISANLTTTTVVGAASTFTPTVVLSVTLTTTTVVASAVTFVPTFKLDAVLTTSVVVSLSTVPTPTVRVGDVNVVFLDPPTNLTVTVVSGSQLDLDWNVVAGATKYMIERDGVVIQSAHPTNDYSDNGLNPSTTYVYRVKGMP